jgi:hypothetical protein
MFPTQFDASVNDGSCFQAVTRHRLGFPPALWPIGNKKEPATCVLRVLAVKEATPDSLDTGSEECRSRVCVGPLCPKLPFMNLTRIFGSLSGRISILPPPARSR